MQIICVNCKRKIQGLPYDSEAWIGAFCSEQCQQQFNAMRERAYRERKSLSS